MMLILHNRFKGLSAAPKEIRANKAYRAQILRIAEMSPNFREECWIRAKHDFVWFIDTFGYTFNPKQHPGAPHRIFILREYQEDMSRTLIHSVGKHDVVVPKARDMGASWVCIAILTWLWQFYDSFSALLGSSKQEYVDQRGNPKSLFWKFDYLIKSQPVWLRPFIRPGVERTQNLLVNRMNTSTLTGESTNPDFGRGSRPAVIVLDEFAFVDCGYEVLTATGDATNSRWFISTYAGAFGPFWDQVEANRENHPEYVVPLHWTLHPGKKRGLYQHLNGQRIIHDKTYHFPEEFKFVNDGTEKFHSPWYDVRCLKAGSPEEIARELDMDPQGSASEYISKLKCMAIAGRQGRPPRHRGYLKFKDPFGEIKFEEHPKGDVEVWVTLDHRFQYVVLHEAAAGADIANGTLNKTGSSSVLSIYDALTNEKVAQVTTAEMGPETFAEYVFVACRFFKGPSGNGPLLNWERNGPGNPFSLAIIKKFKYQNIWMARDINRMRPKKTDLPGWVSTRESKRTLLNAYRAALMEDRIFNRNSAAIMECCQYLDHFGMEYEHNKALNNPDPGSAGDNHGDMVIADALAYLSLSDLPTIQTETKPSIPETSFAALEARRLEREQSAAGSWAFSKRSQ